VNKCARLARRLEYVQDTLKTLQARLEPLFLLRPRSRRVGRLRSLTLQKRGDAERCSSRRLQPLTELLNEVRECVKEFNKARLRRSNAWLADGQRDQR
jgi:hypothetical protein